MALPFTVVIKQPESKLPLAQNVSITGSATVTLASEAVARADGVAMWSVAADYLETLSTCQQSDLPPIFPSSFSYAIGVGYSDAVSTLSVEQGARVESSAASVSLTSRVDNSTTIKARAHINTGFSPDLPPLNEATSGARIPGGELVQVHDECDVTQTSPDELPVIDIRSL